MADEPKTETTPTPAEGGKVVFDSQEAFNDVIEARLARERKKFADYEDIRKKAETLEAEIAKRKEAELTEIEKIKKERDELQLELESVKPYQEKWEGYEKQMDEKIEKEAEGIDEVQRTILDSISDRQRKLDYLSQVKGPKNAPHPGKGVKPGTITLESIKEKRENGDPTWKDDYSKYREQNRH